MSLLDFELKWSKVKVTARLDMVINLDLRPFCHCRSLDDDSSNRFGCVVGSYAIMDKNVKGCGYDQTKYSHKRWRHVY